MKNLRNKNLLLMLMLCCGTTLLANQQALFDASQSGDLATVKDLIQNKKLTTDVAGDYGYTPLHTAARNKQLKIVAFLINEAGADIESQDNNGYTPLMVALLTPDNFNVIKFLLEKGANSNAQGLLGETPLNIAIVKNQTKFIQYLIDTKKTTPVIILEGLALRPNARLDMFNTLWDQLKDDNLKEKLIKVAQENKNQKFLNKVAQYKINLQNLMNKGENKEETTFRIKENIVSFL